MAGKRAEDNLPASLSSFVDRRQETADVRELVGTSRMMTLTGFDGVGKTRLALRVAEVARRSFADGAWLVELGPIADPGLLAEAVAGALRVPEQTGRAAEEALVAFLADRSMLLVMDNCEHLSEACSRLRATVLGWAPGVRVLATSREVLGVPGEQVYGVRPLEVPTEHEEGLASEASSPAVALLLDRLDDRLQLLSSPQLLPSRRTLRQAVEWSYELCQKDERRVWRRLAVFADEFELTAAEAVCAGEGLDEARVTEALLGLVEKSVLSPRQQDGRMRFGMLPTLREFGLELLRTIGQIGGEDEPDEETLRTRHLRWYAGLASEFEAQWFGPDQPAWHGRLTADLSNVRLALDFCLARAEHLETGQRLAADLCLFWNAGPVREGASWLTRLLDATPEPTRARVRALSAVSGSLHSSGCSTSRSRTAAPRWSLRRPTRLSAGEGRCSTSGRTSPLEEIRPPSLSSRTRSGVRPPSTGPSLRSRPTLSSASGSPAVSQETCRDRWRPTQRAPRSAAARENGGGWAGSSRRAAFWR